MLEFLGGKINFVFGNKLNDTTCAIETMPKNYYYDMSIFKRWFERKKKHKKRWSGLVRLVFLFIIKFSE